MAKYNRVSNPGLGLSFRENKLVKLISGSLLKISFLPLGWGYDQVLAIFVALSTAIP